MVSMVLAVIMSRPHLHWNKHAQYNHVCQICKLKTLQLFCDKLLYAGHHHLWNLRWKIYTSEHLNPHVKLHVKYNHMWSVPKPHWFTCERSCDHVKIHVKLNVKYPHMWSVRKPHSSYHFYICKTWKFHMWNHVIFHLKSCGFYIRDTTNTS